jgi:RNA polymerase subunit RPABC4/transcription elongation factor Spt4
MGEGKSIDDILASIMEGRTDQPEIFETLKNVATSRPRTEDVIVEEKQMVPAESVAKVEPEEQFLCPVCDTIVDESDKVCPGCGAEFSEGEATEYECPMCKAAVPSDAAQCPSCGVHFASEEAESSAEETAHEPAAIAEALPPRPAVPSGRAGSTIISVASSPEPSRIGFKPRLNALRELRRSAEPELPQGDPKLIARELPKLVNDVKPLLVSAKRIGLDIEKGKKLINDAVQAGKRRDVPKAVELIAEARKSLDLAFVEYIGGRMEAFAAELDKAPGGGPPPVRQQLDNALGKLERRDYDAAWDAVQIATQAFQSLSKEYNEARSILEGDMRLLNEVTVLGMDVREVERLSKQGRDAIDRRDLTNGLRFAKQAHERLLQDVPTFMQTQMHEARNTLLDLKVRGGDVSKPVGILKEASIHEKNEEWLEAIRFIREFYKSIGGAAKA